MPALPDGLSAGMLLEEAYDVTYGVFDHLAQALKERNMPPEHKLAAARPLSAIAMHEGEITMHQDRLALIFDSYCECKVFDFAHITFEQFMQMTKEDGDDLLALCARQRDKAANVNKKQTDDLANMLEGRGKK